MADTRRSTDVARASSAPVTLEAMADVAAASRLSSTHARLVVELSAKGERHEAIAILARAAELPADDPAALEALGFAAFAVGQHEIARDCYRRVVEFATGDATGWYNFATALRNTGALDEAEQACDRAIALDPGMAQAALLRAHVRTQSAERNHLPALLAALGRHAEQSAQAIMLHYALGKELEDLGEYDDAFDHYRRGAAQRRASLKYDVRDDVRKLDRIREVFTRDRLLHAPALERPEHIFIIGLPRSGTTMVERVLTGHPDVSSNGETDLLLSALMAGTPQDGGDIFERVARARREVVAPAYRRAAGPAAPARLVIEKLPMNYLYAGAIRLTLPSARSLLVERDPLDSCLGMYSTLFGSGYPFSYDLEDLALYHAAYRRLIDHWRECLPDEMLTLSYEQFVNNPQKEGARAAHHVGIDWDPGMAAIERNRSASATASAAQVRRPIYRSAVGRAARFARYLAPLAERLERASATGRS